MRMNRNEITLAFFDEIEPLAMALCFFVGCFLSLSISNKSLIKYNPEATKLKEKNRANNIEKFSRFKRCPVNTGKKISKFFGQ